MTKPGFSRAIPMSIIGFVLGALIVLVIRALQNMDPVWDPQIALVLSPFITVFFFLWGMGALDPKMSEHGEHHEEEDHAEEDEEDRSPFQTLLGATWQITTISLLIVLAFFVFALLDTGLRLDTVGEADGSVAQIGFDSVVPGVEGGTSQLVVFVAFVIITIVSLLAFAGLIGLFFYWMNGGLKQTEGDPTIEDLTPPRPVQFVGRIFGFLANVLRGIPAFLGQKG